MKFSRWTSCRRLPTRDPVGQLLITSPRQVVTYLGFPCDLVRFNERFYRHKPRLSNNHKKLEVITVVEVTRTQGMCDEAIVSTANSTNNFGRCIGLSTVSPVNNCDGLGGFSFSKFRQNWSFIRCGSHRWSK